MRVVVTGGAGFIGSHLVDALRERGNEVIVIDDLSSGDPKWLPADVELIEVDIGAPQVMDVIGRLRPAVVVHTAAQTSVTRSMSEPGQDRHVNLVGTRNVIAGCRRGRSQRIVFLSSGGAIYGDTTRATEETTPHPESVYALHKQAGERCIVTSGIPYAIARLANVYGPRQRGELEGGVVAIFTSHLAAGSPITLYGSGEQSRDFTYVSDVVSGVLRMLPGNRCGIWNIGTGTATRVLDLLRMLERLLAPAVEVHRQPARQGEVFSSSLDAGRINRELGWVPQFDLAKGLAATVAAQGSAR